MDDIVKKGLLLGAGLGIIAEREISEYLKEMEKRGLVNMGDAEKLAKGIIAEKDKREKLFMKEVEKKVREVLKSSGVVNKKDYVKLEKRIGGLNLKITALKKRPAGKKKSKKRK